MYFYNISCKVSSFISNFIYLNLLFLGSSAKDCQFYLFEKTAISFTDIFIIFVVSVSFTSILIFVISTIILKKSRIGLIVRAGVMDKEMIQSLGINIKLVFMLVFMVGAGLAGLSGVLHSVYSGVIYAEMGLEFSILAFIVVVIGGMGSFSGSLFAAILVGLAQAFIAYYVPALSLAVNMLLMTIVLIFRPQGLFQVKG